MATVREWFDDFALALTERSGRTDLPEAGSEYWDDFERALVRIGATWELADEACSIVCDVPNLFPNNYRPMVVEAVRKLQARQQAEARGSAPGSPEEARAASRDCPDCRGQGFAVRYVHPEIHGKVKTFDGGIAPVGMAVSYPCSCPLGRLVASALRQPGQAADPLTVDQYPSLRLRPVPWSDRPDCQFRHRPEHWDADCGMPADLGTTIETPEELKRFCGSLAASKAAPGPFVPPPPREALSDDARAVPAAAYLADSIPDPVIERERASVAPPKPSRPENIHIPEDDAASGWF